ncbi:tRNA uridine-5-carboxymethylaminomethyl(34) synthesis GTPase MnmE [Kiritimatiella glycovorans]|uniref:tRNA modification GTPase MnmE n=1 Tax=Kiritimatiella glycovorans TaxID=1307763 RepID=A0A0G3ELV0_9BACT|nr:tRNA uridine-5-carboxymethylaminomethyl(34) synthesis GTPase MnmE [Kiritimatiella glycovorans]AKJ65139.1 tRNA modification GTPase MnmE [Kiritimatiella glycovorans]
MNTGLGNNTTIAAIATPPGEGGVGIVRISGPDALGTAGRVFRRAGRGEAPAAMEAGTFAYGRFVAGDGTELDRGLCLVMRAPHSFTGEDTAELHGHGGAINLRRILRAVLDAGARGAEPGEFSRRAFLNGKVDLVQAEAICDLVRAQSDRAAGAATEQLEGKLSRSFDGLYDHLMDAAADVEATLDFEENELPARVLEELDARLKHGLDEVDRLLSTWDEGRLLREGARVVILGRPNAGKSTLLNALLGYERAIVTEVSGTTRDTIEEGYVLDGFPVRLVDTAGLRETDCAIEREGIRRAEETHRASHFALYVVDVSGPLEAEDETRLGLLDPGCTVVVLNKSDVRSPDFHFPFSEFEVVETSCAQGRGVEDVRRALTEFLERNIDRHAPPHAVIGERHRALLDEARREIEAACARWSEGGETRADLAAEHLRAALETLGAITGRAFHENLLDRIFSRFCLGK